MSRRQRRDTPSDHGKARFPRFRCEARAGGAIRVRVFDRTALGGSQPLIMAKAPAFPFSPTEIVIALETFHGDPNVTVRQGNRLRGDNPIVHTWPDRFIADGASDDELTPAC